MTRESCLDLLSGYLLVVWRDLSFSSQSCSKDSGKWTLKRMKRVVRDAWVVLSSQIMGVEWFGPTLFDGIGALCESGIHIWFPAWGKGLLCASLGAQCFHNMTLTSFIIVIVLEKPLSIYFSNVVLYYKEYCNCNIAILFVTALYTR